MGPAKNTAHDGLITNPTWMEPMLPPDGQRGIEDAAFDLITKASSLAGQIHPIVTEAPLAFQS